jgi:diguanylate cyclase (GGDEF)-like protein/PAS domain S-box-containing protein
MGPTELQDDHCRLGAPGRLAAVRATGLLDGEPLEALDRLTHLARRLTGAAAVVTLVGEQRQVVASEAALEPTLARPRLGPISHSFCRHVVETDEVLEVTDARLDARVRNNPAIAEHGLIAYLGAPVRGPEGHVLGALCVHGGEARRWTPEERALVEDLAETASALLGLAHAGRALAAAERQARLLGELAPDGVLLVGRDGIIRYANPVLGRLVGAPEGDLQAGVHLATAAGRPLATLLAQVPEGGRLDVTETTLRRPSGALVHVEVRASAFEVDDGGGLMVVVRDLTARRADQAKVAEWQERLRLSFAHAPIGQAIVGLDGAWLDVNPALCQLLGYSSEELRGLTFQDVTHPEDLRSDLDLVMRLMAGEIGRYELAKRYRRRDGAFVWVDLHVSLVRDGRNRPQYFIAQVQDVSERHRLEEERAEVAEELQAANDMLTSAVRAAAIGDGRYQALVETLPDTVVSVYAADGRIVAANGSGLSRRRYTAAGMIGKGPGDLLNPDDAAVVEGVVGAALAGQPSTTEVYSRTHGMQMLLDAVPVEHFTGEREVLLMSRDISVMQARERRLARAEARWRAVYDMAPVAMMELDFDGNILGANPAAADLTDMPLARLVGDSWLRWIHVEDRSHLRRRLEARRAGARLDDALELRMVLADGQVRWVSERGFNLEVGGVASDQVVVHLLDVTDRVEAEESLAYQAMHDPLTGLANRTLLVDRLHQALARSRRSGAPCAVLLLDLDGFKAVNDRLGHAAGDDLLVVVGQRLRAAVRPGDTVARLGGDEFVVLAEPLGHADAAADIAQRLIASLRRPVAVEGKDISVGCSIGIAIAEAQDPTALLRQADIALYRAKRAGRDRWELHDDALQLLTRWPVPEGEASAG